MDSAKLFLSSFGGGDTPGGDPGDPITHSLRFRDSYLERTGSTESNIWSLSFWVKKTVDTTATLFQASSRGQTLSFNTDNQLSYTQSATSGSTSEVFRDPSAWYHIVYNYVSDTDTLSVWVNGESTNQNLSAGANAWGGTITIGQNGGSQEYYLAHVHFIDGQTLEPTVFGRYNAFGVWVPVTPTGLTFGTEGFYLDFSDPNDLGADRSPNGNHFTPNGFGTIPPGIYSINQQGSAPGSYVADPAARTMQLTSPEQTFDGNLYSQVQVGNTADPNTFGGWYYWQANLTNVTSLYFGNNSSAIATEVRINGVSVPFTTGNSGPTNVFGDNWIHPEIPEDGIVNEIAFISAGASTNTQCNGFLLNGNTEANLLVDNISGNYDSVGDSPTQNWTTLNPLFNNGSTGPGTLSAGNLGYTAYVAPGYKVCPGTQTIKDGAYYWEYYPGGVNNSYPSQIGIIRGTNPAETTRIGWDTNNNVYGFSLQYNGQFTGDTSGEGTTTEEVIEYVPTGYGDGDVIGMYCDIPNNYVGWYKNGVLHCEVTNVNSEYEWMPAVSQFYDNPSNFINFGQQPFIYSPPEEYKALQTQNLPEPLIRNGREHFQAITGAGTGYLVYNEGTSSNPDPQQAAILTDFVGTTPTGDFMTSSVIYDMGAPVTYASPGFQATGGYWVTAGDGYQPITTLVSLDGSANSWTQVDQGTYTDQSADKYININTSTPFRYVRMRKDTQNNNLALASPGAGGILEAAQSAFPNGLWWIKDRVNSNNHQFVDSVRGGNLSLNCPNKGEQGAYSQPNGNSVAWCWQTDESGVNTDAGFQIITYTGNDASSQVIPHNLDPSNPLDLVIVKGYDAPDTSTYVNSANWLIWHKDMLPNNYAYLSSDGVMTGVADSFWTSTGLNTTLGNLTVGSDPDTNNGPSERGGAIEYVAYLWQAVPGYSAFGKYKGNGIGGSHGPFIHLGFQPAFLMIKCYDHSAGDVTHWFLHDTTREFFNPHRNPLAADTTAVEYGFSSSHVDLLSNGFKLRGGSDQMNGNHTYVYAAFAENPFQSPVTAR